MCKCIMQVADTLLILLFFLVRRKSNDTDYWIVSISDVGRRHPISKNW